jgi:hypothetical protein
MKGRAIRLYEMRCADVAIALGGGMEMGNYRTSRGGLDFGV